MLLDSNRRIRKILACTAAAFLAGCASTHPLMPSPSLFTQPGWDAGFLDTPTVRRTPHVDLLFATDRQAETGPDSRLPYGEARSFSLAFGSTVVDMVPTLTWGELKRQSHLEDRTNVINLTLGRTRELGRFPSIPYELDSTPSGIIRSELVMEHHHAARAQFQAELQRRLADSASKEVMLYVHGFNETFATAANTTAELCHFLGRRDVCAFFSWPASSTGFLLTSFTTTTESAQFSIGHLKRTIRMIGQTPGVEGIQLLAHSRGAGVLIDALRELLIETIAAGSEPAEAFKIDNIVLMAPDIDKDVARKRFWPFGSDPDMTTNWTSETLPKLIKGRLTVYASPEDRALILSTRLFRSRARVGTLSADSLLFDGARPLEIRGNVDFVILEGERTDFFGHSYFASNPEVSSDLIQLLRFGKKPGEPGRPLEHAGPVTWIFPKTH